MESASHPSLCICRGCLKSSKNDPKHSKLKYIRCSKPSNHLQGPKSFSADRPDLHRSQLLPDAGDRRRHRRLRWHLVLGNRRGRIPQQDLALPGSAELALPGQPDALPGPRAGPGRRLVPDQLRTRAVLSGHAPLRAGQLTRATWVALIRPTTASLPCGDPGIPGISSSAAGRRRRGINGLRAFPARDVVIRLAP